ncbi:MAG: aminoglycoside phosphotransferase family protein, partial [Acidimicrobiales bacterium]|nr:aminoglycoside phosphotransferase family protein [Acidimicrobiales bacterium]
MIEAPTRRDIAGTVATAARLACSVGWERLGVRRVTELTTVPPSVEAISPEWLTAALCPDPGDASVSSITRARRSSGTSVRCQLRLSYSDNGRRAGLPESVFVKSTPSVFTRMANGLTNVSTA